MTTNESTTLYCGSVVFCASHYTITCVMVFDDCLLYEFRLERSLHYYPIRRQMSNGTIYTKGESLYIIVDTSRDGTDPSHAPFVMGVLLGVPFYNTL
jgi:hypothetical protein